MHQRARSADSTPAAQDRRRLRSQTDPDISRRGLPAGYLRNRAPASPLAALRLKLTLWYVGTLCVTLALLGGGLYFAIGHQFDRELRHSLRDATAQLERAAQTRELESAATGRVVDAVEELHIADRALYLATPDGTPITPSVAPQWLADIARAAAHSGVADRRVFTRPEHRLQLHAERFTVASGRMMIAVAAADNIELEDRYAALIATFGAAAAGAILLVLLGGWLLVRQATEPIEQNMSRMRQFMADAAHELRTPVTVLRTQAEVTLDRPRESAEYVAALESIASESRRVGRIVDDLLTLARADSGERRLAASRVFLDDIVADAVAAAQPMAKTRGVALTVDRFDEAPVLGDPELLRQLTMILLDNAIKFTEPGGSVQVSVGIGTGTAFLRVTDDGCGISSAQLPHLFERFFRGDPARPRTDGATASGAGLGLAIAKWITDLHGGVVQIAASAAAGTVAEIVIPLAPVVSSS